MNFYIVNQNNLIANIILDSGELVINFDRDQKLPFTPVDHNLKTRILKDHPRYMSYPICDDDREPMSI